jgi:hypothetical protein
MVKKVFQLYVNTTDPNAINVSPPNLLTGRCNFTTGSSQITITTIDNTIYSSTGVLSYDVPLIYGIKISVPSLQSEPFYLLTLASGTEGGTGTYYMSTTALTTATNQVFTGGSGFLNKNSYTFLVNWDSLFQEAKLSNRIARQCRVGVDFISQESVLAYHNNQTPDPSAYRNGILACNLATHTGNKDLPYTVLGNTDILSAPIADPEILIDAPSYKSMFFKLNTMEPNQMTDIIMPTGSSFLNLALYSAFPYNAVYTPQMIDVDWKALLSFEIDDDDDHPLRENLEANLEENLEENLEANLQGSASLRPLVE